MALYYNILNEVRWRGLDTLEENPYMLPNSRGCIPRGRNLSVPGQHFGIVDKTPPATLVSHTGTGSCLDWSTSEPAHC